jgi:hypothetical protein
MATQRIEIWEAGATEPTEVIEHEVPDLPADPADPAASGVAPLIDQFGKGTLPQKIARLEEVVAKLAESAGA